jgi:TatD DNase family protein
MKINKQALTKMYDAHTHFNDPLYQEEMFPIEAIIEEAELAGVGYFNNVGFSLKSSVKAVEQVKKFSNAFAIIGVHPNEVGNHS